MCTSSLRPAFIGLMLSGLGSFGAAASFIPPLPRDAIGAPAAIPGAMCGFSCRGGGRYIPGPPSVCYARGLNYCGSSRGYGPPPYVERRFYGPRRFYGGPYGPPRRYGW
jgi:hypothetical protein